MIDFEKLLTDSLNRSRDDFLRADADLRELINRASDALEKVSAGRLRLRLGREDVQADETRYDVFLIRDSSWDDPDASDRRGLFALLLPPSGYPMLVVDPTWKRNDVNWLKETSELADRAALEQRFHDLFSDPRSPVIVALASLRREDLDATGT